MNYVGRDADGGHDLGRMYLMRTVVGAGLVCLASWIGLFLGAGNVGLQRSVSVGPGTLIEHPVGLVLAAVLAFVVALALTWVTGPSRKNALRLVAAVLIGDALGSLVLAPVAVGELTVLNAPVVFVALTALGLQPLATFLGAMAHRMLRTA